MEPRNYSAGASASPPAAEATPSVGYPTEGDPGIGTPATVPGAAWFHQVAEELRNIIVTAGLTPDDTVLNQIDTAIATLIANATPDASTTVKGLIELLTPAELATGTDTTRAVTAASLFSLFGASSLATNGYVRIPVNDGTDFKEIILQMGNATTNASGLFTLTFPIAFPNNVFQVFPVDIATGVSSANIIATGVSPSLTQALFYSADTAGSAIATPFSWFGIGN